MKIKKLRKLNSDSQTLSVVLSTINEESNIGLCLNSVKSIADEIVVVDEESTDKTRDIARKYGAKVYKVKHEEIFHKTKQKALDRATGDWILQLDADERVTRKLAREIREELRIKNHKLKIKSFEDKKKKFPNKWKLFERHQNLIEQRDGLIGKKTGEVVAFFIPRMNHFLGKPLKYGGVYPDGVIRLVKRGKARFPAKSVHELMEIEGKVAWLFNDLEHHDSPTLSRYLERANRYTDLTATEFKEKKLPVDYWNLFKYSFLIPGAHFLLLFFRHKGFLDGMRGFIWSLFSALHFPIAYFKYWQTEKTS
jgi:glycosyltransferase involved in cell wall biosynthesis